mmetsp:Transcript_14666/g.33864  ORF Transcript_14666/g.33864 Transcript_14666/m.33864 type:complete len:335 (-) Transcript_14666:293-1297(-)
MSSQMIDRPLTPRPDTPRPDFQPLTPAAVSLDTTVHNPESAFGNVKSGNWEVALSDITWGTKIGEGAMGVTFKAKLKGRKCVAKKLKQNTGPQSQAYKDLIMELDIRPSVGHHPNLVEFYGACIVNLSSPIILEELVKGPNLEAFMTQKYVKLERNTVYGWTLDIVRALDFLHNRNPIIIHRNLKPASLMLTADYSVVKLKDFRMSKKVDAAKRDQWQPKGRTGTVRYISPEELKQGNCTEKVDIYSASLIIWYIAAGRRPAINDMGRLDARPELGPVAWPELEALISKMWAQSPPQRPSAGECIRTLEGMPGRPDLTLGTAPANVKGGCCVVQ